MSDFGWYTIGVVGVIAMVIAGFVMLWTALHPRP